MAASWGHFLSSSTFDPVRQGLTGFPLGPSSPEGPLAPAGPAAPGGPASPFSPLSPLGPCSGARVVKIGVNCSGLIHESDPSRAQKEGQRLLTGHGSRAHVRAVHCVQPTPVM